MPRSLLKLRPRKELRGLAGAMPPPLYRSLDVEPLLNHTTATVNISLGLLRLSLCDSVPFNC